MRSGFRANPANKSSSGPDSISFTVFIDADESAGGGGASSALEETPNSLATVSHEDLKRDGCSVFAVGADGGETASLTCAVDFTESCSSTAFAGVEERNEGSEGVRAVSTSAFLGGAAFLWGGSIDGVPSKSAREFQWSDMNGVDADR